MEGQHINIPAGAEPYAVGSRTVLWPFGNRHIGPVQAIVSDEANRLRWRCRGQWWDASRLAANVSRAFIAAVICSPNEPDDVWGLLEVLDADLENGTGHLSIVMRPDRASGPWAVDAAHAFCASVFDTWPQFYKLNLEVLADNTALVPGLRRLLRHEGTLRGQTLVAGVRRDVDLYAVFPGDVERLAPHLVAGAGNPTPVKTILIELGHQRDHWSMTLVTELDSLSLLEILNAIDSAAGHEVQLEAFTFDGATLADVAALADSFERSQP